MSKADSKSDTQHPRNQESIKLYKLTQISFSPADYFQLSTECFDQCYNDGDLKKCTDTCIRKKSAFREYACSREALNILFKYS